MELKYPNPQCEYSPTGAHWYVGALDGIWQCKYCPTAIWQPKDYDDAKKFGSDIKMLGIQKAYNKWLQHKPETRRLLTRLNKGGDYARVRNTQRTGGK